MMKPSVEELCAVCPEVDERLVRQHVTRLDDDYFNSFSAETIHAHVRGLARLSENNPVELLVRFTENRDAELTILAFDYSSEFALLTGTLAGMGFGIVSGEVFTYERAPAPAETRTRRRPVHRLGNADVLLRRRRIIDHFFGHLYVDTPIDEWEEQLQHRLTEITQLLERGDEPSTDQAKQQVNELVTRRLVDLRVAGHPVLFPVHIEIDNEAGPFTRVRVVSQDTPAFLYALTTAFALNGLLIEHVHIETRDARIEDVVDLTDSAGHPIRDRTSLDKIRLSVLMTKQFTYFLDRAPDPFAALARFEQMVAEVVALPDSGRWLEALANPRMMQELARLLGVSDYIWEDFIRLQYESLLPVLQPHLEGRAVYEERGSLADRLAKAVSGSRNLYALRKKLNAFKNREIFLIDLDHILNPDVGFRKLAERLTALAEVVVTETAKILFDNLARQYGRPKTVAGLEASYAILGLGKLGGAALGYASDIELMFVYSDSGRTDGENAIDNLEYFGYLADQCSHFIEAKREGIFKVDLRLRPHGNSGPKAVSQESFCSYYGPGGPAHSAERLALVRMRAFGGDLALGHRVERFRDEYIYATQSIDVAELRELRARQFENKNKPDTYNAKFSPGALVDLEYAVQILQVMHGDRHPALRTPRIHLALQGLKEAGVLDDEERNALNAAYDFMRQLINALRLLRGSARDLFLPEPGSAEFIHLARRMGYERDADLEPAQKLNVDFRTHTAAVRAFVERHFGRGSLPGPATGNVADLVLSDDPPPELREDVLGEYGFADVERAYANIRRLAGTGEQRAYFAKVAVFALDLLREEPNPDMALSNWERFRSAMDHPLEHITQLMAQPRRLEVLLGIFSRSQFLADTLIRSPELWDWVTTPALLQNESTRAAFEEVLRREAGEAVSHEAWLEALRRFRHRHMLRIGTRDMCMGVDTRCIMRELSTLAEAVVQVALERAAKALEAEGHAAAPGGLDSFCILAFGKLGGRELNYSSDIDLIAVYDDRATREQHMPYFARLMARVHRDLTRHMVGGYPYRVDLRLRPYGSSGEVVSGLDELAAYYKDRAALWEIQATLKLRPIAGNLSLGNDLMTAIHPMQVRPRQAKEIYDSIRKMRELAQKSKRKPTDAVTDVKVGIGGIRDVEFLVQGLQLVHAPHGHPELLTGNTLEGLERLAGAGILEQEQVDQLSSDYLFLRRIEHHLQVLEDRQIHALPEDPVEREVLARRVLGPDGTAGKLEKRLSECLARVHEAYVEQVQPPS